MTEQSYANHRRTVKGFHLLLGAFLLLGTIAAFINVYLQWSAHYDMMSSILITLLFICGIQTAWYTRVFALKAQDRAIRAEENFRHYVLAHKSLDGRLTMAQVIALRFAPDDEFAGLADRAARENLTPDEIKRAVKKWRADHHRA